MTESAFLETARKNATDANARQRQLHLRSSKKENKKTVNGTHSRKTKACEDLYRRGKRDRQ